MTVRKTIKVSWEPATKFSWEDNGKLYIGYNDRKFGFDLFEDDDDYDLQRILDNCDFVEMGYGSNVVFVLPKTRHKIKINIVEDET